MSAARQQSLVVGQYEDHIKFQGRAPRTLAEKAIARAEYDCSRRMAEIKVLASKLAQLDPLLPALAERGIRLADRELGTFDHGKTLRIQTPLFTRNDDKLHAVLLELGFREIERKPFGNESDQVLMKFGRSLVVRIDVAKLPQQVDQAEAVPA